MSPVEERVGVRVLSGEELTVDKLLALFGRAEARDFVDLLVVAGRYGVDRLLDLASEKDRGFDAAVFVEVLGVDRSVAPGRVPARRCAIRQAPGDRRYMKGAGSRLRP